MTKRNLLWVGGISALGVAIAYAFEKASQAKRPRIYPREAEFEFRETFAHQATVSEDANPKVRFEDLSVSESFGSF